MTRNIRKSIEENKFPIQAFLLTKAFLVAVSLFALTFLPAGGGFQKNSNNLFLNGWAQWDGKAYLTIAEQGYVQLEDGRSLQNFLPFYPFLIRAFSFIGYDLSAFLISSVACLVAIIFLYKLVLREYGEKVSRRTVFFVLLFPTAFFLSAVYTESLFLALATASFYYARDGKWAKAGIISVFLPLTRIIGFVFFVPLMVEYFNQKGYDIKKTTKTFVFALFPLVGVLLYILFSFYSTGDFIPYFQQNNLWSRTLQLPHEAFIHTINVFSANTDFLIKAYLIWGAALACAAIALVILSIKKLRHSYIFYSLIVIVPPLFSGTLEGFSRFLLPAFPLFMTLALLCEQKKYKIPVYAIYAAFFFLLVFLTAHFVTGAVG